MSEVIRDWEYHEFAGNGKKYGNCEVYLLKKDVYGYPLCIKGKGIQIPIKLTPEEVKTFHNQLYELAKPYNVKFNGKRFTVKGSILGNRFSALRIEAGNSIDVYSLNWDKEHLDLLDRILQDTIIWDKIGHKNVPTNQ